VNVGISVSRVGGNAQIKAMKEVAGTLRLDLAQYRELAAFAQFGSDLDVATQRQLTRGARLVEILKQDQYVPMAVEMQIVQIVAGTNGLCDDIELNKVVDFMKALASHLEANEAALLAEIIEKGTFKNSDLKDRVIAAVNAFKATWNS
jgi:F-type H+-transporting ATPase subunit alpha